VLKNSLVLLHFIAVIVKFCRKMWCSSASGLAPMFKTLSEFKDNVPMNKTQYSDDLQATVLSEVKDMQQSERSVSWRSDSSK